MVIGPPFNRYTGPAMTLGNMRANGVRRLAAHCHLCHHSRVFDADGYGDDVPVPSLPVEDAMANAPDGAPEAGLFRVPRVIGG